MATGSCMFAAVCRNAELAADAERRAARLRAFYGFDALALARPQPRVLVGETGGSSVLDPASGTLVWGEPLPSGVTPLDAGDTRLRSISGITAVIAWSGERLRIVNNSAGPAALYVAEGDGVIAYATHAVAAAVIAGLDLRVDEAAVPQFVALDYVGGDRTLVEGVRVLPAASVVELDGPRTYWPSRERWQRMPDAYAHTEAALLSTLAERTRDQRVGLALTGGLDSSVGAAALRALDVTPLAFTWGSPQWPDAQGAAATAEALGLDHEVLAARELGDDECLRALDREARWTDGVTALAATERRWPESCEALAVGMGGETGRAFHYDAWSALLIPRPRPEELARRLGARGRLRGAREEAIAALEEAVRGWVDEAIALDARGWDALDVVYTDQRVRRWGRSQIPRLDQNLVLLFTPAKVARGLASLPLRERLGDGFHRRFLAEHGLAREPADVPNPSRVSLVARRLRHRLRRRSAPATPPPDTVDMLVHQTWSERPLASGWVRDEALTDPLIERTLGNGWAQATAEGFTEGRAHTTERALRAAGVVAFARALDDLK